MNFPGYFLFIFFTRENTTLIVYDESRGNEGGRESNTSSECFALAKKPGPGKFTCVWNVGWGVIVP